LTRSPGVDLANMKF